jgi:biotin carboxylase
MNSFLELIELIPEANRIHFTRERIVLLAEDGRLGVFPQGDFSLTQIELLVKELRKHSLIYSAENVYPGYGSTSGKIISFGVNRETATVLSASVGILGIEEGKEIMTKMRNIISSIQVEALVSFNEYDEPITSIERIYVVL